MILYVFTRPASTLLSVDAEKNEGDLQCATVVLQHSEGPVGFDRALGADAIQALVHDVVLVERANKPEWALIEARALSSGTMHRQFRRVVTCSVPDAALLRELETVSSNRRRTKENELLARHRRQARSLIPTVFDDWIAPTGLLRAHAVAWLVESCRIFVLWSFSDRGLYASILGRSVDDALGPALRAGEELGIPVRHVHAESDLPTW